MMTFIDWFAGIGGFRRGMELAGHKCVGFCEFDKYAVASYTSMHLITDEQRAALAEMDLKKRQKEILKEKYRNGEWYGPDVTLIHAGDIPRADCWCFGFPCQDISIAGKMRGLEGNRSSLFFRITRLLRDLAEEDRPNTLFIENVKHLLGVNKGFDFARVLIELDEIGYDCEWDTLNSKDFGVPQNRERLFIIGHLRGTGRREVFPLRRDAAEAGVQEVGVEQIAQMNRPGRENLNQYRVYDKEGIAPCLNTMEGGGREPHIVDDNHDLKIINRGEECESKRVYDPSGIVATIAARDYKDAKKVAISQGVNCININDENGKERPQQDRIYDANGVMTALNAQLGGRHNVATSYRIRKLTPKECFRLQGWTDDYFEKAEFVNSNSQLYKQAGNGVTVSVIYEIGRRL